MSFENTVDRAVRELAEEARKAVTNHPETEALADYQEGRLTDHEAERIRRHLVACAECAREVLELETFDLDQLEDAELRPSDAETTVDWATFQRRSTEADAEARVLEMPRRAPVGTPVLATTAPTVRRWLAQGAPLAASILIALTGLGFWVTGIAERTKPTAGDPREAAPNPFAFDLIPDGEGHRRNASPGREVEVPAGLDLLVPRLNLGDQTPYTSYRAEILDADGTSVWSQSELPRQPAGQFIVVVKRASLPAGEYRLRIVGRTDGEETDLAIYSFRLRYSPTE